MSPLKFERGFFCVIISVVGINKNKKQKNQSKNKEKWNTGLEDETKRSIWVVFSFSFFAISTLSLLGKAGILGEYVKIIFNSLLGRGFFMAPITFLFLGIALMRDFKKKISIAIVAGVAIFFFSSLGVLDLVFGRFGGGYLGFLVSYPMLSLFDYWVSVILLFSLFLISFLMMLNSSFKFGKRGKVEKKQKEIYSTEDAEVEKEEELSEVESGEDEKFNESEEGESDEERQTYTKKDEELLNLKPKKQFSLKYVAPPLDLLEDDKGIPSSGDIKANANVIRRTLQNFGIDVEMFEVNVGPSVTQYTLKPAEGIKLSRITALVSDLSLALAAHPLRIEAPIPGKSLVGIEVPNRSIALVGLRSLLSSTEFQGAYPLTAAFGRDVTGSPIFADVARMPHLLIAGATGSGKSITIHTLIVSLLYKNSPEFLRFLLVDPKRVELTTYNEIPHLLTPVIVDSKKAVMALRWAVKEMERRYEVLSSAGARDINSYNGKLLKGKNNEEIIPNIVIIIDELADLISTYPREVEASIVRLAQMSRAVGIHLIVSTQRPSVEVITGLIKANITARIALQVASQVDSRTILDMSGAEKLLGNGDMLYLAGDTSKPKRIQGAFISEKEVKKVSSFIIDQADKFETEEIEIDSKLPVGSLDSLADGDFEDGDDDELFESARELIMEAGKASASLLQRRLRVGYARAARLLDMLEERGVVGPGDGAKPREVFISHNVGEKNREEDLKSI